jgi:ABC-type branched-subunit amino acid transport system substrate-binding protein
MAGAQGAAKVINAEGGFGGHPVKLVSCNSMFQPAATTECAHTTLSDHPVAMFGCEPEWPITGLAVYAASHIPSFNCLSDTKAFQNKLNFGMGSGTLGEASAMIHWLCKYRPNDKRIADIETASPQDEAQLPPALGAAAKKCGMTVSFNWINPATVDLAPIVDKIVQAKPSFIISTVSGSQMVILAKALQSAKFPTDDLSINSSAVDEPNVFGPAGSALDGVWITDEWEGWGTGTADATAYLKAMAGNSLAKTGNAVQGFMYLMWMYTAAKKIGFSKFNSTTLASFSNTANGVPSPMLHSVVNPGPAYPGPQLKNPWVQLLHWTGGKMVPVTQGTDGGWINSATAAG